MQTKKVKIAFINPPHADWCLANNATYLMLQSHYNRKGKYPDLMEWIDAPYKFNKYQTVKDVYDEIADADIYLFSSYVWNYGICDDLAEYVKQVNPSAILVIGGPHIGRNDPLLIKKRQELYHYILQVTKPGEVFITDLLDSYIENNKVPDYQNITWEFRSNKTCSQFMPDYSVYEEHEQYLTTAREWASMHDMEPFSMIETTRGCPYSCSFCEWGGGIGSKIYKKPLDIVKRDILALKRAGYRDIYLTDANFGAFFERDVEIFRFGKENNINLTDISTMKSTSLDRRKKLIDAWFSVVGKRHEQNSSEVSSDDGDRMTYVGIVPTVSLQSVSEAAMKIAKRVDLSFEDKIKLSEYIHQRCHEEGYPTPPIELILGMPGSTIDDFYEEMNVIWNFKAWASFRHDYLFLPDSNLTDPEYIAEYDIKLVEVYTDLVDEAGVDNDNSLYRHKKHYYKTIASCFSYTNEELREMWFMNMGGNYLLEHLYEPVQEFCTPATFSKLCFAVIKQLPDFAVIWDEITDLLNPDSPPRNSKRLHGQARFQFIINFLKDNKEIIFSEVFKLMQDTKFVEPVKKETKKTHVIPIMELT